MIGLCTDSSAQLPPELAARFDVEIVPVIVSMDGHEYLEGVDLDADEFYRRLALQPRPEVSTASPSSGQFALAYDQLVERGASEILSIHVGSGLAGIINAARLGARQIPVPIRHVDTGQASFGVGCSVWGAAQALAAGADLDEAAAEAERVAASVGHVLIAGEPALMEKAGMLESVAGLETAVLSLVQAEIKVLDRCLDVDDAITMMARRIIEWMPGRQVNVGIGIADRDGWRLSLALERLIAVEPRVREIVRYRIGPSIGGRTGLGTADAFFYPV